jgi:hypothetical protein
MLWQLSRLFQFRNDRSVGRMTIDIDDARSQIPGTPQGKLEELFGGYAITGAATA